MGWTESLPVRQALWRSAIESGLGVVAAYVTPERYSLASMQLAARTTTDEDVFLTEIQARIELGKALALANLLREAEASLSPALRHSIHYGDGRVEGTLLVPLLLRERAGNRLQRVPVLRTRWSHETPEAFLISEAIRLAIKVCSCWRHRGGAEAELARRLMESFVRMEVRPPWSEVKSRSRPSIASLAGIVKDRTIRGWNTRNGPVDRVTDLFSSGARAVSASAGAVAFLISNDERFENRLFELICLGWLIGSFQRELESCEVHEEHFRVSSKPILTGTAGGKTIRLFYQANHLPGSFSYIWKRSGQALRAIPDFVVEVQAGENRRNLIIDAKNRTRASRSEIIYKLLGYKENLAIEPYWAIGVAPSFGGLETASVVKGRNKASVAFVPLRNGHEVARRIVRTALRSAPPLE